jgi:hypothetical protein
MSSFHSLVERGLSLVLAHPFVAGLVAFLLIWLLFLRVEPRGS